MWLEAGYDWPHGGVVEFQDRRMYHASGMLGGEKLVVILEKGYPVWEPVLDHEVGMVILGAKPGHESPAIQKRCELAVCYPEGDTGYCDC